MYFVIEILGHISINIVYNLFYHVFRRVVLYCLHCIVYIYLFFFFYLSFILVSPISLFF